MQGSIYSDAIKEKAIAMLGVRTVREVSKKLKIPESTLRDWNRNANKINPDLAELRDKKKKDFANKAWEVINESLSRVSAKWLAEKFGGISARSVNRMPIDKLLKKCAEHELDIEIKWYKGDRRYYLKTNKKSFIYLPKALIEQFFGATGNGQF